MNYVLNSCDKETAVEWFTKPLRGVLGGHRLTIKNKNFQDEKIMAVWQQVLVGILLFTVLLPYTVFAGISLIKSSLMAETRKWKAISTLSLALYDGFLQTPGLFMTKTSDIKNNYLLTEIITRKTLNLEKYDAHTAANVLFELVKELKPFEIHRNSYLNLTTTSVEVFFTEDTPKQRSVSDFVFFLTSANEHSAKNGLSEKQIVNLFADKVVNWGYDHDIIAKSEKSLAQLISHHFDTSSDSDSE